MVLVAIRRYCIRFIASVPIFFSCMFIVFKVLLTDAKFKKIKREFPLVPDTNPTDCSIHHQQLLHTSQIMKTIFLGILTVSPTNYPKPNITKNIGS